MLVLNWNGLEHLEECFSSLVNGCAREDVEFVLLDNGSTDDSVSFVQERFGDDPRVVIEQLGANYGWSGGNNRGIQSSMDRGAKYVFLLNNDTAVVPGCIESLLEMAEADEEIGGLAPKMLLFDQPWLINSIGLECSIIGSGWDRGLGRIDAPRWDEVVEVVGICGGAMWLRTDVLRRVGLFPEEFGIYLDDLDLCLRIWESGSKILTCPNAKVLHKFSATWEGTDEKRRKKYFLNTRNRFWLVMRNFPHSALGQILFWIGIGELKAIGDAVERGEFWRIREHGRAWRESWRYLSQARAYRKEQKVKNTSSQQFPRYWHLIKKTPLFCPEVVLPKEGWYPYRVIHGETVYPISRKAIIHHQGGKLTFHCGSIFPELGGVEVEVKCGEMPICSIQTTKFKKVELDLPKGEVILECRTFFSAEQIGESFDVGAWIKMGV